MFRKLSRIYDLLMCLLFDCILVTIKKKNIMNYSSDSKEGWVGYLQGDNTLPQRNSLLEVFRVEIRLIDKERVQNQS